MRRPGTALRRAMSPPEVILWNHLRQRPDGFKFRRQHPFADYILDFACLERMLVVGFDGGQHGERFEQDSRRTRLLESAGFVVLRFWNNEVFEQITGVVEVIQRQLVARAKPSPPNPPLEGEG